MRHASPEAEAKFERWHARQFELGACLCKQCKDRRVAAEQPPAVQFLTSEEAPIIEIEALESEPFAELPQWATPELPRNEGPIAREARLTYEQARRSLANSFGERAVTQAEQNLNALMSWGIAAKRGGSYGEPIVRQTRQEVADHQCSLDCKCIQPCGYYITNSELGIRPLLPPKPSDYAHRVYALTISYPLTAERFRARVAQIPDGAEIVGVEFEDFGRCLRVGVRHPRFRVVEEGCPAPRLPYSLPGFGGEEAPIDWPWEETE